MCHAAGWINFRLVLLVVMAMCSLFCILVKIMTKPFPDILNLEQKKCFKTSKSGSDPEDFPSLDSPGSINLSVIVPAYYNEELRLPKMLEECLEFLKVVVSDVEMDHSGQTDSLGSRSDNSGQDSMRTR